MPRYINVEDALQAHPEFLNEQIDDHDKAAYAKGWNDCNKEYYNSIAELPVASMACTDLSTRLRRAFEADELVNQRLLLDAADAIEELLDELTTIRKQFPRWISVEDEPPKENGRYLVRYKRDVNLGDEETVHEDEIRIMRFFVDDGWRYPIICNDHVRLVNEEVTHWVPLPAPPKGVE